MGSCLAAKNVQDDDKIHYDMEWIDHPRCNALFEEASSLLRDIEEIRSGLEDSRKRAINISNVKMLREPSFHEAIRVLFWAISANNKGKFSDAGFEVLVYPPYVTIKNTHLFIYTTELNECLTKYIATIVDGP